MLMEADEQGNLVLAFAKVCVTEQTVSPVELLTCARDLRHDDATLGRAAARGQPAH
jgi:hypothetical protein